MGLERRYRRQQERETDKLRQRIHDEEVRKMKENPEKYMKDVERYLNNLKEHYDKQKLEDGQNN